MIRKAGGGRRINILILYLALFVCFLFSPSAHAGSSFRYVIFEVYGYQASNSAVLNEVEIYDDKNNNIVRGIIPFAAYDQVTGGLPAYWNGSPITGNIVWDKTNLTDGYSNYDEYSGTAFLYPGGSDKKARFAFDLGSSKNISSIRVSIGGSDLRAPKSVSVYVTNTYNTSQVNGFSNDGLVYLSTITPSNSSTPQWYNITPIPPAPSNLTMSSVAPTGATVIWDAVEGAGSYNVYLNNSLYQTVTQKQCNLTGLTPNATYTVKVTAVVNGVEGSPAITNFLTPKPPTPTGLTVSNVTSTGATVTWDPVPGAESYNVYLNDFLYAAYVTGTYCNITGLNPATSYTVRVTAVISNVEGDPATTSFTTYDQSAPVPPAPPSGFTAQATGPTQVRLNWNPNTEPDLVGYIIYRNNSEIARVDSSTTTYTDSGLTPNTSYTYGIKAYNTSNLTSDMRTVQVTTPKPPPPTNLTVSNVTTTGAMVTWDPVSGAESYNVYINDFLYDAYLTQTQCNITGLDPATSYTVRVTSVISNVEGDPATTSFTTLVGYKPKLNVRVDSRQIIMSWESTADSFIVEINGQQVTTTTDKQYTYTAEPGTYEVRVIAVVDGQQYPSDPVTVTVSAFNTPGVVQAAKDILGNTAAVIFPFGGLIALGLALKASPLIIAAVKSGMLTRWFRGW